MVQFFVLLSVKIVFFTFFRLLRTHFSLIKCDSLVSSVSGFFAIPNETFAITIFVLKSVIIQYVNQIQRYGNLQTWVAISKSQIQINRGNLQYLCIGCTQVLNFYSFQTFHWELPKIHSLCLPKCIFNCFFLWILNPQFKFYAVK